MIVGVLHVRIHIPGAFNLKDKRSVIRSALDHVRNRFHTAAAETGLMDLWNHAELGFSCVSNDAVHVESILSSVLNFLDNQDDFEVVNVETDRIPFDSF